MERKTYTQKAWLAKAEELFGKDPKNWKFRCVRCGHVQSIQDFIDNKIPMPHVKVYHSCIGRWVKDVGCDWTLGGLIQIHEVEVIIPGGNHIPVFDFSQDGIEVYKV